VHSEKCWTLLVRIRRQHGFSSHSATCAQGIGWSSCQLQRHSTAQSTLQRSRAHRCRGARRRCCSSRCRRSCCRPSTTPRACAGRRRAQRRGPAARRRLRRRRCRRRSRSPATRRGRGRRGSRATRCGLRARPWRQLAWWQTRAMGRGRARDALCLAVLQAHRHTQTRSRSAASCASSCERAHLATARGCHSHPSHRRSRSRTRSSRPPRRACCPRSCRRAPAWRGRHGHRRASGRPQRHGSLRDPLHERRETLIFSQEQHGGAGRSSAGQAGGDKPAQDRSRRASPRAPGSSTIEGCQVARCHAQSQDLGGAVQGCARFLSVNVSKTMQRRRSKARTDDAVWVAVERRFVKGHSRGGVCRHNRRRDVGGVALRRGLLRQRVEQPAVGACTGERMWVSDCGDIARPLGILCGVRCSLHVRSSQSTSCKVDDFCCATPRC
jgi:hypothetical protein